MSYEQRDPNIAKTGFETSAESKLAENQIVDNSKSNQYSGVTAYSVKKSSTEPNPSSSVSYSDTSASFSSSTPGSDLYVQKEKQFDYSDDASKKTMMEKGKDLAANAKETAMNVGEKVKEKVSEGVAVAREKVNEGVSMAREKMDQMKSNKSGLSSSSDVIQDRMVVDDESRVELLHDNFANPDRSASEIKTEANQIFSEIKSDNYTSTQSPLLLKDDVSMSSKAGAKLDEAKLKAQELKLEGQAKAEELKAEGSMKLDEVKLKAQELKVVGQAKAEELKAEGAVKLDQAKVKATELKNVAMEKLSGATEIAKEKAIEAKDFAMEKLQEGKEMVQDYFQKNKSDNGEIMMKEDLVKQQPAYVTRTTVITESEPGFDKRTEVRKEINETAFIEGKRDTVASETGSKLDSTTA